MKNLIITLFTTAVLFACNKDDKEIENTVNDQSLSIKNATLNSKIDSLNDYIETLELRVSESKKTTDLTSSKNEDIQKALDLEMAKNKKLEESISSNTQVADLLEKNKELEANIEAMKNNKNSLLIAKYITDNKKLQLENNKLKSEQNTANQNYSQLYKSFIDLKNSSTSTSIEQLTNEKATLTRLNEDLKRSISNLEIDKDFFKTKADSYESRFNATVGCYKYFKRSVEDALNARGINFNISASTVLGDELILN